MSYIQDPTPTWYDVAMNRAARQGNIGRLGYRLVTWDHAKSTEGEEGPGFNGTVFVTSWFATNTGSRGNKSRLSKNAAGTTDITGGGTRYTTGSTNGDQYMVIEGPSNVAFTGRTALLSNKKWGFAFQARYPTTIANSAAGLVGGYDAVSPSHYVQAGAYAGVDATHWSVSSQAGLLCSSVASIDSNSSTWHQFEVFQDQTSWYFSVDKVAYVTHAYASLGATIYPFVQAYKGTQTGATSFDIRSAVWFWELD